MNIRKIISFAAIAGVLFAGVWFLAGSNGLGAETAQQAQALRALGPAGVDVSTSAAGAPESGIAYPTVVNTADIVPVDVDSQYDKWLRGEIDLENDFRASDTEIAAYREAALSLPASSGVDDGLNGGLSLVAGTAFDSLSVDDCCGGGGVVPPDPEVASGDNYVVAVVNLAFAAYEKNGTEIIPPTTYDSFFASVAGCAGGFDPTILYDAEADRWAMGIDADGINFCFAVSDDSNPVGNWYIYEMTANQNGAFHDYPHTGVGEEALFVGANNFGTPFEARAWAINKWEMYANSPATWTTTVLSSNDEGTPQPLNLHTFSTVNGPDPDHYFVMDPYDGCNVTIAKWASPLSGGAVSEIASFDLCAETGVTAGFPISYPQMGGSPIQANDIRMRQFEDAPSGNGHAWVTDSISCNPGGGTVDCVRWFEVDMTPTTPTLVQAGVYASDSDFRVFPDLAVDVCDNMAIGYTKSNTSMYPSVYVAGRESGDPTGTLQGEVLLKAGEEPYSAFDGSPYRWGDYTAMSIDPDGVTFWYIGEYAKDVTYANANWGTYIGSYTFPSCAETASPQGKIYEVTVKPDFAPEFQDCFRFSDPNVLGDFTVDGLGVGKWIEIADLGDRFLWRAKAGGVKFNGVTRIDGNLRARGRSVSGNYRILGFENPGCTVVESVNWGE